MGCTLQTNPPSPALTQLQLETGLWPFSPLRRASGAAGYRPDRAEEGPCAMPRQFHLARGPGGKGRGGVEAHSTDTKKLHSTDMNNAQVQKAGLVLYREGHYDKQQRRASTRAGLVLYSHANKNSRTTTTTTKTRTCVLYRQGHATGTTTKRASTKVGLVLCTYRGMEATTKTRKYKGRACALYRQGGAWQPTTTTKTRKLQNAQVQRQKCKNAQVQRRVW